MLKTRPKAFITVSFAVLVVSFSVPAAAYIDGGTASLIFQALIAGGLAALVVVKQFWANIKAYLQSMFGRTPPPHESE